MKGRKNREAGGVNLADDDLSKKNQRYTYQSNVNDEAEERKKGGRAKRKRGGDCKVEGEKTMARADRKPRKSGGSATSNPFSSARSGTAPAGHKVQSVP